MNKDSVSPFPSEESIYIHGATEKEAPYCPISYPIYQSATFENPGILGECEYSYSRCKNPTRAALEKTISAAETGKYCFAFSSGLSAILAVFATLSAGDHVVMSEDIYGGTHRLMRVIFKRFGVECDLCDMTKSENTERAIKKNTKLVFFETPTNPMCRVIDICETVRVAHSHGVRVCVDNTFMTPYLQKPLSLGADIVVHSGTKYLCGHNDTMAGFVVCSEKAIADELEYVSKTFGNSLSPFDAWLVMRGMKTLELRLARQEKNAKEVFLWLSHNRNVSDVFWAGDGSGEGFEIMKKQARGFGSTLSFRLTHTHLLESVLSGGKTIIFAESLGGVESLITYPLTQTHATTPEALRKKLGIDENLLRLSCGIEPASDIICDLENALGKNL